MSLFNRLSRLTPRLSACLLYSSQSQICNAYSYSWSRSPSISAMVKKIEVEGYAALNECLKENTGTIFVLFSGSLDENGVSWCPDCVKADPVIERNMDKAPEDAVFIHCHVGRREYWKDQSNEFRTDPKFFVRCVPTLLRLGSPQRLQEDQCCSDDLIEMMFQED